MTKLLKSEISLVGDGGVTVPLYKDDETPFWLTPFLDNEDRNGHITKQTFGNTIVYTTSTSAWVLANLIKKTSRGNTLSFPSNEYMSQFSSTAAESVGITYHNEVARFMNILNTFVLLNRWRNEVAFLVIKITEEEVDAEEID